MNEILVFGSSLSDFYEGKVLSREHFVLRMTEKVWLSKCPFCLHNSIGQFCLLGFSVVGVVVLFT